MSKSDQSSDAPSGDIAASAVSSSRREIKKHKGVVYIAPAHEIPAGGLTFPYSHPGGKDDFIRENIIGLHRRQYGGFDEKNRPAWMEGAVFCVHARVALGKTLNGKDAWIAEVTEQNGDRGFHVSMADNVTSDDQGVDRGLITFLPVSSMMREKIIKEAMEPQNVRIIWSIETAWKVSRTSIFSADLLWNRKKDSEEREQKVKALERNQICSRFALAVLQKSLDELSWKELKLDVDASQATPFRVAASLLKGSQINQESKEVLYDIVISPGEIPLYSFFSDYIKNFLVLLTTAPDLNICNDKKKVALPDYLRKFSENLLLELQEGEKEESKLAELTLVESFQKTLKLLNSISSLINQEYGCTNRLITEKLNGAAQDIIQQAEKRGFTVLTEMSKMEVGVFKIKEWHEAKAATPAYESRILACLNLLDEIQLKIQVLQELGNITKDLNLQAFKEKCNFLRQEELDNKIIRGQDNSLLVSFEGVLEKFAAKFIHEIERPCHKMGLSEEIAACYPKGKSSLTRIEIIAMRLGFFAGEQFYNAREIFDLVLKKAEGVLEGIQNSQIKLSKQEILNRIKVMENISYTKKIALLARVVKEDILPHVPREKMSDVIQVSNRILQTLGASAKNLESGGVASTHKFEQLVEFALENMEDLLGPQKKPLARGLPNGIQRIIADLFKKRLEYYSSAVYDSKADFHRSFSFLRSFISEIVGLLHSVPEHHREPVKNIVKKLAEFGDKLGIATATYWETRFAGELQRLNMPVKRQLSQGPSLLSSLASAASAPEGAPAFSPSPQD